jgi:hypothetical protein
MHAHILLGFALAAAATAQTPAAFIAGCELPFAKIATSGLKIDTDCAIGGDPDADPANALQNAAKNNFCATGRAEKVTPKLLGQLQKKTADAKSGITFGDHSKVPADRKGVQAGFKFGKVTYGEGELVRMAAFIIESHPSDTSEGESVNCKTPGAPENDVHIALGNNYGDNECTSVTAELSPHGRPEGWHFVNHVLAKDKTSNPAAITNFPVRIQGALFFDASHKVCKDGKALAGNPSRQSLWEIHPVYQIDVCKNKKLGSCKVEDESVWTPIQDWTPPSGN